MEKNENVNSSEHLAEPLPPSEEEEKQEELVFMRGLNYVLSENQKIATKTSNSFVWDVVIKGNLQISKPQIQRWSIYIQQTSSTANIMIGVAPITIDQNINYLEKPCGFYVYCNDSRLSSGPPYNYAYRSKEEYGRLHRIKRGQTVGVEVNTVNATIQFFVDGKSLGIAYENIPLETPLCPVVLLFCENECVEIKPFTLFLSQ